MQEWSQDELLQRIAQAGTKESEACAVFLYTPFCGTCKLTERMLSILLEMEPRLPIYKSNVNFLPEIVRSLKIRSIPCILILRNGEEMEQLYTMQSVDVLYKKLMPLINENLKNDGGRIHE